MNCRISDEELNSDKWAVARQMCEWYGYDIHEIAAEMARFRELRDASLARAFAELTQQPAPAETPPPATLAHWNTVAQFWDRKAQRWTKPGLVYIGRAMPRFGLPGSVWGNPFRISEDTDDARLDVLDLYDNWLDEPQQAALRERLPELHGMTLVCWCYPRRCHGEVLVEHLRALNAAPTVRKLF